MSENARPSSSLAAHVGQLRRIARRLAGRNGAHDTVAEQAGTIERSGMFDREWYLRRYKDVAGSGLDPIEHYVKHGAAEGRDPCATFNTAFYVKSNPDVAASGMNPLCHFIDFGQKEGRKPHASQSPTRADGHVPSQATRKPKSSKATDAEIIASSGIFDREFYLREYPGVAWAGMDPVSHYIKHGARENRNPCILFDTRYYLRTNPDVAASGMNPLRHFCEFGARELRNPSASFDMSWYWLSYLAENGSDENPLAHYLAHGKKAALEVREVDGLTDEDKKGLVRICEMLLGREAQAATDAMRIGIAMSRLSLWAEAEKAFRKAVTLDWNDPAAHERLANVLSRQGKWWQVVDSLAQAVALVPDRAPLHYRLGDAQERMNRFAPAADSYRRAIELDPNHAGWYYRLGYACEMSGSPKQAKEAYAQALSRDGRDDVVRFGVGMLHQMRGYWPEAADAYAEQLRESPLDADLHYRHGMAQDRCYRWDKAIDAYETAISLDPSVAYWHYRYGFVLERAVRYAEAAVAYQAATALNNKHVPYWHYRQAYALDMAGKYEQACAAYLRTRTVDPEGQSALTTYLAGFVEKRTAIGGATQEDTSPEGPYYRLGEAREAAQDWDAAAQAYADAVARSNAYRPGWYYRLGFSLYKAGRFKEACEAFRETRILRRPFGVDMARYLKNPEQRMLMEYNEYLEMLPVREKHVLYESMHGTSMGGNPYAIFEHLLNSSAYAGWTHVWVLAEGIDAPMHLRSRRDVVIVERQNDLYRRYLATASHLISDVTFPYWFIRRPEQKYLNTWHGTPMKKLGKDIPGEFMVHGNIQRNFLHATHLISPNRHTSEVLLESYDLKGILSAKLAEIGYPRIDRVLLAKPNDRAAIRARLGLTGGKPVVLYAPTWRGAHGSAAFDTDRLINDLGRLADLPCQFVFRGHHMVERLLDTVDLPVTIARQDIDTSDVLAITDILITDYSSIFVDFLPLRRPIFHYCYDWRDYEKQRGLYFDVHSMPGHVCENLDALVAGLTEQLDCPIRNGASYDVARQHFCPHEDGKASERACAFFFDGDDSHVVDRYGDSRPSLLLFNGLFPPNGITSSFLNLVNSLATEGRDQLTVVIEPQRIAAEPLWLEKFRKLPSGTNVICRVGGMVQSPEECWIGERLSARRRLYDARMWGGLQHGYEREFRRIFGEPRYTGIVNFEGYSGFWTTLLGLGSGSIRNIAYLHNDMAEEFHVKHPYLEAIFGAYRYYEKLVSVSEVMSDVNRKKLGAEFGLASSAFVPCINSIDVEGVHSQAAEPLDRDLCSWLEERRCFLTMGRMSPEKDQSKLVEAFAQVHEEYSDIRLVIFGDGPLKQTLEARIAELGLDKAIYLAGLRDNPYPALSACSCFVLPSNHEGQPMVLLEAMTLRRPIVATDIDGNRGVLGGQYGKLVHNSVKGLVTGMREFLSKPAWPRNFDANEYQAMAMDAFRGVISETAQSPSALSKKCVIDSNKVVIAARADGLGERMNALLNAMFLAEKLRFKFAFYWSESGTWEITGADRLHHAIVPEQEFFSRRFIENHSLENFSRKGFREISGKNVTSSDLMEPTTQPEFKGWLAPRIDLKGVLSKELLPDDTLSFRDIFRRIGFSDSIDEAVRLADAAPLPSRCISLHLRSGDIFYGPYRKWVHYSYKGITLPIAKAIINKIKSEGADVLLFGQDNEVLKYLGHATGALLLEDVGDNSFQSPAARAIYELVVMSRCDYIVAGSSGFARQASLLGGVNIKQPKDFFDHKEQTRISLEDLARYGDQYHPLQTAFAYWYAYFYGRQFKSVGQASELLTKASHFDPDNQLYPIKLAACYFKERMFPEGESVLRRLVTSEFAKYRTPKLPCFDVLVAKTLGKFNLAEDFEFFSDGAASGMPFCTAFHYVISRASNADAGRTLEFFNDNRGNDVVLTSLYQSWTCEQC